MQAHKKEKRKYKAGDIIELPEIKSTRQEGKMTTYRKIFRRFKISYIDIERNVFIGTFLN